MNILSFLNNLKHVILKIKQELLKIVLDTYTNPYGYSKLPVLIWRTFRYRAAGIGIYITDNERILADFKDKHKGKRAFILGNGPSLNLCDLGLLKNELTFGVNSIFLNYEHMDYDPTYYVVEDVLVAEDRAEEINVYNGPIKLFGNYLRHHGITESENTLWINVRMRYDDYPEFPYFSRNALKMLWTGGTVTYLCMQLAYYMGFSEVYLVGFDHSYKIPPDFHVNGNQILSTSDDPNHFHPDYFGKGYRWHDPMLGRMEKSYRSAKRVYDGAGRRIFNATVGGKLEIFDRIDYQSLF